MKKISLFCRRVLSSTYFLHSFHVMFLHLPAFLPPGGGGVRAPQNRSFFSPVFGSSVGGGFRNGEKSSDERDERRNEARASFVVNKCQCLLWLIFIAKVLCILAKKGSPSCFPQVISFHVAGAWAVSLSLSALPPTFAHFKSPPQRRRPKPWMALRIA